MVIRLFEALFSCSASYCDFVKVKERKLFILLAVLKLRVDESLMFSRKLVLNWLNLGVTEFVMVKFEIIMNK